MIDPDLEAHLSPGVRRCRLCGIRKVLDRGFYRDRKSRGGYRRECKRCRDRAGARWARGRYVPKTGRRHRTKADRAVAAARERTQAPEIN